MAQLAPAPLVEATDLTRHFAAPRSFGDMLAGRRPVVRAVDGVSLRICLLYTSRRG